MQLRVAIRPFLEAPANTSVCERMMLAREAEGLEGWLAHWPPSHKALAREAFETMARAIRAEGELRADFAAVLKTQIDCLELRRAALMATRNRRRVRAKRPPAAPSGRYWWQDD